MDFLSFLCKNHGFDGHKVRKKLKNYLHVSLKGEDFEILEPVWLRKELAGKIKRMWNKYKEDK